MRRSGQSLKASLALPHISFLMHFKPRKPKKCFIHDPPLQHFSTKCKAAWTKWCEASRPKQSPLFEEKNTLKRLSKNCANRCRARRDKSAWLWREQLFKEDNPKRFKASSNQPSLGDRLLIDGIITSNPQSFMAQWKNHFSSIATSQSHSNSAVVEVCKKITNLTSLSKLNSDDIVDDNFAVEEVELALKKLKTRKAGGLDGLQPEHLKYGGALLTLWFKQIFNAFIRLVHTFHPTF